LASHAGCYRLVDLTPTDPQVAESLQADLVDMTADALCSTLTAISSCCNKAVMEAERGCSLSHRVYSVRGVYRLCERDDLNERADLLSSACYNCVTWLAREYFVHLNHALVMVAAEFLGYIQSFSVTNSVGVDDIADRANYQWNVIILFLCMTLVTVKQYFMSPLVCYFPTTLSGANVESYITNMCWVEGTFPINLTSGKIPTMDREWNELGPTQMSELIL
ncbi:Innexin inx2, partial [Cichlidogyrus casuarinus]